MSSVVINGDTSGAITIAAPAVSGTNTITMPAQTGNMMVNGPAFSAYLNGTQSIPNNSATKINFNAEFFDTNNCFDSTTNYRFTPTVAGYYQINLQYYMSVTGTNSGIFNTFLYKNGSNYLYGNYNLSGSFAFMGTNTWLVYLNGTTDYVEAYILQSQGSSQSINGSSTAPFSTIFSGSMVRGA